jgi:hypothetical protein
VVVGPDGDLRAVARLPGARLDLDHAVGDLGDLQLEEPLDQPGVGAGDDDLGALRGAPYLDDVGLEAGVGLGPLVGHLLRLGQQRLHLAQVEQGVAAVALLDDAGDDVAFAVGVLLELAVTLGFADALAHDLTEGLSSNAAHLFLLRRVVALVDPVAVFVDVVGGERELHRVGVDFDHHFFGRSRTSLVRRREGIDEDVQQRVDRDVLLVRQHSHCF